MYLLPHSYTTGLITMFITSEVSKKTLSVLGGLMLHSKIMEKLELAKKLDGILPISKKRCLGSNTDKFRAMVLGFIAGAECLDDMDVIGQDPGFQALNKHVHDATQYGNFLRSFDERQCKELMYAQIESTLRLRFAARPQEDDFVLDIDSSNHAQHARKMEGLGGCYDGTWGLSSLQAYDQFGFNYWMAVRAGNTNTIVGSHEAIATIFQRLPRGMKKTLRADRGYCAAEIFNVCHTAQAKFVICAKQDFYLPTLHKVTNWKRTQLRFKDFESDECEIGHSVYRSRDMRETARVVILRARKKDRMFEDFEYFAFITNIGQHEWSDEKVIKFYRKRGNAENFIRETKYNFDLKHFPCQKLLANRIYGVLAAFAHNIMRFTALVDNSKKISFAKGLRFRTVNLACEVAKHARYVTFRFVQRQHEEVKLWLEKIHIKLHGLDLLQRYGPRFLTT